MTVSVEAHAKINLALDVLDMRQDGFHNIDTVFYEIDLADRLDVAWAEKEGHISVHEGTAPADSTNLAVRATKLLAPDCGVTIDLWKRIPAQAGLGGGSSDAAAALQAIEKLSGPMGNLADVAVQLGSDVPFFLLGGCARGTGRGEILTPIRTGIQLHVLLVKPDIGVPTGWAYQELDAIGEAGKSMYAQRVNSTLEANDRDGLLQVMGNDFERVVVKRFPEVVSLVNRLKDAGSEFAMLCGSGSAVFGVFPTRDDAQRAGESFTDMWHAASSGLVRKVGQ